MSGRSCSVACAVFFALDPAPSDEPSYRAERYLGAVIGEKRLQLGPLDVRRRLVSVRDESVLRLNPYRTSISALRQRRGRPVLAC